MSALERGYIRACGNVAKYLTLGDTEHFAFWWNRKRFLEQDLGLRTAAA